MKYKFLMLLTWGTMFTQAQNIPEVTSTLKEVTVFLKGAQLTRTAKTDIPAGTSTVKLVGMSPFLDRKTLLVKGLGDFTILSVNHQLNYLNEKKLEEKFITLNDTIASLTRTLEDIQNELATLMEKESFLKLNQTVKGTEQLDAEKLKAVHQYFGDQLNLIRIDRTKKTRRIKEINVVLAAFQAQLAQEKIRKQEAESEVLVEVNATKAIKAEFVLSYMVVHAAWFPSYDIRVKNVQEPLKLLYKANISQTTGEDWKNVALTISNANPYLSGTIPELNPWYLNFGVAQTYYKKGGAVTQNSMNSYISNNTTHVSGRVQDASNQPLPYAVVRVTGTSIGTVTDADGNFTLAMPEGSNQLEVSSVGYQTWVGGASSQFLNIRLLNQASSMTEVVVSKSNATKNAPAAWSTNANQMYYGSGETYKVAALPVVHRMENQANLQITLDQPYTIESNGKQKMVDISQDDIPAYYEYRAIPKLEKAAFLVARVDDWARLNLLEGEANLYFENTYVGKTVLDVRYLSDTLNISLGRDRNVVVSRQKVKSFSTREFIGSDRIEKRGFEIKVRNNKKESLNLVVYDQIPVSTQKDMFVTLKNKGEAEFTEANGELKWMLTVSPGDTKDLNFGYEVKYPKGREVTLE
jgi:hypothetical protein